MSFLCMVFEVSLPLSLGSGSELANIRQMFLDVCLPGGEKEIGLVPLNSLWLESCFS